MVVLAHAGHWFVSLMYFLPVLAFLVWLGANHLRERRGDADRDDPAEPGNAPR